jgi:ADP-ribose pyrophosphatase YjhB (NUDIX family)
MNLPLESIESTLPIHEIFQDKKNESLDALAIALATNTALTYPLQQDRLFLDGLLLNEHGLLELPNSGPWVAGSILPTRRDKYTEIVAMVGHPKQYQLDTDYRPLHPWWKEMVRRPDIGGVIGKGFYYHWGANYTADAAVTATDSTGLGHLLLIRRKDTGEWALPGGFVDDLEISKQTALRELNEESSLDLSNQRVEPQLLYRGPVLDIRTTLHAWAETSLWAYSLAAVSLPNVAGGDDATEATWFPLGDLPDSLYGSHPVLIDMVLNSLA